MQFTPQQLTGGPKYHHKTRIGNWSEARLAVEFVTSLKQLVVNPELTGSGIGRD